MMYLARANQTASISRASIIYSFSASYVFYPLRVVLLLAGAFKAQREHSLSRGKERQEKET